VNFRSATIIAIGIIGARRTTFEPRPFTKKLLSNSLSVDGDQRPGARDRHVRASKAALAAKGRTIAVIGAGLLEIIQPENRGWRKDCRRQRAIVSEFSMEIKPRPQTFPCVPDH